MNEMSLATFQASAPAPIDVRGRNAGGMSGGRLDTGAIDRAAEEFEAVFLSQMLAPMFETLSTDGPFGGGHAEKVARSLMVDEYGKAIARAGGVGIAETVRNELLKLQEVH